jgi:S-adenosyl-L-methionine hydrolase (adenosine-forming)
MAQRSIITLLTDFGARDAYAAAMKGVILSLNPEAVLVDVTHEISPQDVRTGAFVLAEAAPYFPAGAIHLAVVDPGVGSARRGLAASAGGRFFVGPDNGLFHFIFSAAADLSLVSLENPAYWRRHVSATFHGRDVFAPIAAHLSLGTPLDALGPPLADPVFLPLPEAVFTADKVRGEIIHVDHFGNLVSNIRWAALVEWLAGRGFRLHIGSRTLTRLRRTYADAAPGEALALEGSHAYLEIACNQASASARLEVGVGAALFLERT